MFDFSTGFVVPDKPREKLALLEQMLWSEMPKNFRWNFAHIINELNDECGSSGCAVGLWIHVTGRSYVTNPNALRKEFALTLHEVDLIFYHRGPRGYSSEIKPFMVADRIHNLLSGKAI